MDLSDRARIHAALGDPARLGIVDALEWSDRTFSELAAVAGLHGNATAHHLAVLEDAGLIDRHVSEGDHRRRYIRLRHERLGSVGLRNPTIPGLVLFVCTHNSARSQFAAAFWAKQTGRAADSAGATPALAVHPWAVLAARRYGIDLHEAVPKGYAHVSTVPDFVVSVCDRALEGGVPFDRPVIHWSVPDPVTTGTPQAFEAAFADVAGRIHRLAGTKFERSPLK